MIRVGGLLVRLLVIRVGGLLMRLSCDKGGRPAHEDFLVIRVGGLLMRAA